MLKGTLFGFGGGLLGAAGAASLLGPVGLVVGAGMLGSGYVWAHRGLRGAAMRYRARARELIDALASRATNAVREETLQSDADVAP